MKVMRKGRMLSALCPSRARKAMLLRDKGAFEEAS